MPAPPIESSVPKAHILVVDDEVPVRSALMHSLVLLGYRVDVADSGHQALQMLEHDHYDLMLLDICMPDVNGVEVMRRARQARSNLSIIIITAHAGLESAIAAIKCDADDYLQKPVGVHDIATAVAGALQKRAEVLHRQQLISTAREALEGLCGTETSVQPPPTPGAQHFLRVGSVTLDSGRMRAIIGDDPARIAELSENEMAILAYMMERPEQVISCHELASAVLGYSRIGAQEAKNIVRPNIFRLRRKVEVDPAEPRLIRTVRGRGYLLVP